VLLISRFLARSWIGNLDAQRKCKQTTAEVGETVRVRIVVKNHGFIPVPWVLLEDLLPRKALSGRKPRLRVKGQRMQVRMLGSAGQAEIKYQLKLNTRGYYQIGPLVLESGDLFGLHRRYRVATDPHFLLVYPKVVPLEGYDLSSRRPIGEIQLTHRLYEDPTRITGVREYQPGDPLNRVHWRATARMGLLHCKVYEPSTVAGANILLDLHAAGYPSRAEPERSELAVTAAASLAHAVCQMGQQVGLVTNGRDAADRIRQEGWEHEDFRTRHAARKQAAMRDQSDRLQPVVVDARRGVEQFERIRETLARVELTDGLRFAELVLETAARLARDATVVAVLPEVAAETALALGNLRRRGLAVTAVLVQLGEDTLDQAYARLLAEGIRDVRHVKDEGELPSLCQHQVERGTPYALAVEL
jgi:uncharacterized protein (DUF58 family)